MKKYIDNDPNKGLDIDWKLIRKELKKLGLPNNVYTPSVEPLETANWFVELSERSIGKTTGWLLLGLVIWKLYKTPSVLVRSKDYMLEPKVIRDMMNVINSPEFNYIGKITDGKYNSSFYYGRRWYFCNKDENGAIADKCDEPFLVCLSVDKSEDYKSTLTLPDTVLIIFDEFIGRTYPPNEIVYFMDICKTVLRDRIVGLIVCCANTISKHSPYFDELGIKKTLNSMRLGEQKQIKTKKGTTISIHLIEPNKMNKQKKISNSLFFGFDNPKLNAIVGGDWAMELVPHIPSEHYEILCQNHYVKVSTELVRLALVKFDTLGYGVIVTNSTTLYNDSVVYTHDDITDKRYRYGLGFSKLDRTIWNLYRRNKFYYATNDQGDIVQAFLQKEKGL